MDLQKKVLKYGAAALAFALCLRLLSSAAALSQSLFQNPGLLSLAVFLQTGRVVRYPENVSLPTAESTAPMLPSVPAQTQAPTVPAPEHKPAFSAQELQGLSVIYGCDYRPDLESLLLTPLTWDLTDSAPTVLILHTHATESYADSTCESLGDFRTLDGQYNMLSVGDALARLLEAGGLSVLHDRTLHDYPDYNSSYVNARQTIAAYLEAYPSIQAVIDLHRDAVTTQAGTQLSTSATVNGQPASQIMLVVGTDASGKSHPDWQKNLSLALKLWAQLERRNPGISRPLYLRSERFNMDMTPGSLLIEIGASGDTHAQALTAVSALAEGLLALAKGTSQ